METLKIFFLAVVQGLTEFLPLSSSGHLAALCCAFDFNFDDSAYISIVLHAGTLLSIIVYYCQDLICLLNRNGRRMIAAIIIGTLPAGIVGLIVYLTGWNIYLTSELGVIGVGFLISGVILQYADKLPVAVKNETINLKQALVIGLCQSLAIVPGISRIGTSLSAGLWQGLGKVSAARFSFFLSIPIIGGMLLVKIISQACQEEFTARSVMNINLSIGFTVSAITGYIAIEILLKILQYGKISIFSNYLFIVGWIVIVWRIVDAIKG